VWKRREGGHIARARVTDPATGKLVEIKKVLHEASEAAAFQWLTEEKERIREGLASPQPAKTRFSEYAASLFERKVTRRELKSARSRERWKTTLVHLIRGTRNVPGFGDLYMDQIQVVHVEEWHVDTQLTTPEQQVSELLFPTAEGHFRSENVLRKPFQEVARLIGLPKKITPRGMRRTFNDLARVAHVESLVTKSISGHKTDRMKDHYSTVSADEQRESIGRVLHLVESEASGAPGGTPGSEVVLPGKKEAG